MPFALGTVVAGYEFNNVFDFDAFLECFESTGFQATNLHNAIEITRQMRKKREQPRSDGRPTHLDYLPNNNCTIFLAYTSNMVSSGNRDLIRFLVEHSCVDALVTTCGGIEEDLIKCLAPTHVSSFRVDDAKLREERINRIGNLVIPSTNYTLFEDWITPIFTQMQDMQDKGTKWTPSKLIRLLGEKIKDPRSIYYWAYKNNIPVFCPAITDGALGDLMYFYSVKNPGLSIDVLEDLTKINNLAKFSPNTGMLIVGSGVIKHHTCNANLMA